MEESGRGDGDRVHRAVLGGQADGLLGVAVGVDHDGDALVVVVEDAAGPHRAVAGRHAPVPVHFDAQTHGAETRQGPWPPSAPPTTRAGFASSSWTGRPPTPST